MDSTAQSCSTANTIILQGKGRLTPAAATAPTGPGGEAASSSQGRDGGGASSVSGHQDDPVQGLKSGALTESSLGGPSGRVTATQWAWREEHQTKEDYCPDLNTDGTCLARFWTCLGLTTFLFLPSSPFRVGVSVLCLSCHYVLEAQTHVVP